MTVLKAYDPALISLVFDNQLITGIQDGTFVEISRDEDSFFLHVGGDGEAARARNSNRAGTIKFTLMQSSPSNDVLSALATLDENTGGGVRPVMVKDNSGTTVAQGAQAWIQKPADVTFAKEPSEPREWLIRVADLRTVIGGAAVAA